MMVVHYYMRGKQPLMRVLTKVLRIELKPPNKKVLWLIGSYLLEKGKWGGPKTNMR